MKNKDFYKIQWERTKVNKDTFNDFPDDIKEICRIIQHLLIHPATFDINNVTFEESRIDDRRIKSIQEIIDKIFLLENRDLIDYRNPENRVVAICKHFSMFLCSVLREKWVPARCRCGFATYFVNGRFEDHWICEYYSKQENRWLRVDAQIDNLQILQCQMELNKINPLRLEKESFFTGWTLWKMYRQWFISWENCWFSLMEIERWEWYIRGNMLRDFFALNKIEYHYNELNRFMVSDYLPNEEELLMLDEIADLTLNVDSNLDKLTEFYERNKEILKVNSY